MMTRCPPDGVSGRGVDDRILPPQHGKCRDINNDEAEGEHCAGFVAETGLTERLCCGIVGVCTSVTAK
jgi:hypothetical protein